MDIKNIFARIFLSIEFNITSGNRDNIQIMYCKEYTLLNSTNIIIDAKQIIETFIGMIKREITDEKELEKLDEAIALKNVSNMPARVKCALLAWHTMEDMLNNR